MRLLFLSYSDINSGNATRVLNLAKNLATKHKIDIFFDGSKNNHIPTEIKKIKNIKIKFTPYLFSLYPTLIFGILPKFFRSLHNYDIIHCFKPLPSSFKPAWLLARFLNSKLVLDWDDWEGKGGFADFDPKPLRGFLDWFQRFSVKHADAIVTATPFLSKEAEKLGKKPFLVQNGADISQSVKKTQTRPVLAFAGLLFKSCDLDYVIEAMPFVDKKIKLVVIGDGPRKQEFVNLAKKSGVLGRIEFRGFVQRENVAGILAQAAVVALPMKNNLANRARSPVKLGEYLSAGKAVVANPVGVAAEVIRHNENGILVKSKKEFAEAVNKLVSNTALRQKIEKNARKTAEKELDWKKISEKLDSFYSRLIS